MVKADDSRSTSRQPARCGVPAAVALAQKRDFESVACLLVPPGCLRWKMGKWHAAG